MDVVVCVGLLVEFCIDEFGVEDSRGFSLLNRLAVRRLGFGKIDPDDKHNFCTFDQAAYSVLQNLPSESTCTLKIYLVANEKSGTEEQFLGEGQFPLPVDDKTGTF